MLSFIFLWNDFIFLGFSLAVFLLASDFWLLFKSDPLCETDPSLNFNVLFKDVFFFKFSFVLKKLGVEPDQGQRSVMIVVLTLLCWFLCLQTAPPTF